MMVRVAVPPAVQSRIAYWEDVPVNDALVVLTSVTSESLLNVFVPATAASRYWVMLSLTVVPHVPDSSPETGRARPKSEVYAVVMV
jgi:hypothetical protein